MLNFVNKFLEKENGNKQRYRLIYSFGLVIHAFYAIAFYCLGVTPLFIFNCFSTLMYLIGALFIKNNKLTLMWVALLYGEIVAHGVFTAVILGWNFGFSMYCMAIIPLSYFVTYMDKNMPKPLLVSTLLAVINITIMFVARIYCYSHDPLFPLPMEVARLISVVNMIIADAIHIIFSMLYITEIRGNTAQLKQKNEELNFLANYDSLTSLRNRHHMADVFAEYEKSTKPYCVILGDIDDFKRINDTYGHAAGDLVLKRISEIISKAVGDKGVVCRWGGEEILTIISGNLEDCFDLNEKIRLRIQNMNIPFERKEIHVTMTYGFADYGEAMTIEKLISIADSRLYKGKKNGKNQTVYH